MIGMKFVEIPKGKGILGSPDSEHGRYADEEQYKFETEGFYMQETPVTQAQWEAVMGKNPSRFSGEDCPVENVSWHDVQEFIAKLNELYEDEGITFRLPTEAEWEYACRAGTTTAYHFGDDEDELAQYAWYNENSTGRTHPVKQKLPNPWGLYDMYGNVWEWCKDEYVANKGGLTTKDRLEVSFD